VDRPELLFEAEAEVAESAGGSGVVAALWK